jgi:hypothetical protein
MAVALALAGLSALSQPPQPSPAAPSGPADQTVTVTASAPPISLPAPVYVIASREFEPLRGQYALADGRTLTVSGRPKRMKAQMSISCCSVGFVGKLFCEALVAAPPGPIEALSPLSVRLPAWCWPRAAG